MNFFEIWWIDKRLMTKSHPSLNKYLRDLRSVFMKGIKMFFLPCIVSVSENCILTSFKTFANVCNVMDFFAHLFFRILRATDGRESRSSDSSMRQTPPFKRPSQHFPCLARRPPSSQSYSLRRRRLDDTKKQRKKSEGQERQDFSQMMLFWWT